MPEAPGRNSLAGSRSKQESKSIAGFSYKKVTQTMLARVLYSFVDRISDPVNFKPYTLGAQVVLPPWADAAVRSVSGCAVVSVSRSIRTPRGELSVGNVVEAKCPAVTLGRALLFVQTGGRDVDDRFWLVLAPFRSAPGMTSVWLAEALPPRVVELCLVSAAKCSIEVAGRIVV